MIKYIEIKTNLKRKDGLSVNILEKENCMAASIKAVPKTFHSGTLLMYNVRARFRIQLRELSVYRSLTLYRSIYMYIYLYTDHLVLELSSLQRELAF